MGTRRAHKLGGEMKEEVLREIQRKISESFDRALVETSKPVLDEERLKEQREGFVELLFKSAERQLIGDEN